jgi:hypothetical protein
MASSEMSSEGIDVMRHWGKMMQRFLWDMVKTIWDMY